MNTTKNTPSATVHKHPLRTLDVALRAAGASIALVNNVSGSYRSLKDQVIRSASSVPANLAEGHGRTGKDRQYHWNVALGSAREVDVHIRLLVMAGVVDASKAEDALQLFDSVRAMTWRLLHPRR
jgi:four helix bundle protein